MMVKVRSDKAKKRFRRKIRIRNKISGSAQAPRISVFRSNRALFVQAIDDEAGKTICSVASNGSELNLKQCNIDAAKKVGEKLGEKLAAMSIERAVFDRNGYLYHGKIAALANAIREKNIKM